MSSIRLQALIKKAKSQARPSQGQVLQRFFKTGPGEYGEGDRFLGIMVPEARRLAKEFSDLDQEDLTRLIQNPYHELRLIALFILTAHYQRAKTETSCRKVIDFYLKQTKYINNWDLVDLSVYKILGDYLLGNPKEKKLLNKLARSKDLWERRMAMITTFAYLRAGSAKETLEIATILLKDKHDLIQKAVGWMLREMGKRVSAVSLKAFLDQHHKTMPRTALRYAIERLKPAEREYYLYGGRK